MWDLNDPEIPDTPLERALMLRGMIVSVAQNGSMDQNVYAQVRAEFMNGPARNLVPPFIRTSRDQSQLWAYLKSVASGGGSWEARREHIYKTFEPLLAHLEGTGRSPADSAISDVLASFDTEGVHESWEKALARRHEDPDGAITTARSLLETVCKCILEEAGEEYGRADDLPRLYKQTSKLLNLSPSPETEEVFRNILGGCHTVVQNLGTLRNKIGDAHGQGRRAVKPAPRHAALAVNLAGSMATFLVETWRARQTS